MRRLLLVAVVAVFGVAQAQTPEEIELCGDYQAQAGAEYAWTHLFLECMKRKDTENENLGWKFYRYSGSQLRTAPPLSTNLCANTATIYTGQSNPAQWYASDYLPMVNTHCEFPDYPEPEDVLHGEWSCEEWPDNSWSFCYRENSDGTYDGVYNTRCGGSRSAFGMTWEQFQDFLDEFEDATHAVCTPYEPVSPDDPGIACIGTDGIACEMTLQDVRHILGMILQELQLDRATNAPPTEAPEQVTDDESFNAPGFDRSQGEWGGFTAPEFDETAHLEVLQTRIADAVASLRATAETRFPFGMVSFVPTLGSVGTGSCADPQLALMGQASAGIGWCGSAIEDTVSGPVRSALAFLVLIGFGFAAVTTVSRS